ncbi:MAG: hypothetical protein H6729_16850, partial [Deltaproteobacteria bacterium]|nr:hypothetical protein [Deltaproteobacteria bacterium]
MLDRSPKPEPKSLAPTRATSSHGLIRLRRIVVSGAFFSVVSFACANAWAGAGAARDADALDEMAIELSRLRAEVETLTQTLDEKK